MVQLTEILPVIDKEQFIVQSQFPDSKVHGANMGPTCVLSAPDGPHVGPINLAIRERYDCWWSGTQGVIALAASVLT